MQAKISMSMRYGCISIHMSVLFTGYMDGCFHHKGNMVICPGTFGYVRKKPNKLVVLVELVYH